MCRIVVESEKRVTNEGKSSKSGTSARAVLIALTVIFGLPIVIAWVLTVGPVEWRPRGTLNKGLLLKPPVILAGVRDAQGMAPGWSEKSDEWYLVALARPGCSEGCQELLAVTGKVKAALGKNINRVHRAVLHAGPGVPLTSAGIELWVDEAARTADNIIAAAGLEQLYQAVVIADSAGRAILVYPPPYNGPDILRDLKRLLRASAQP